MTKSKKQKYTEHCREAQDRDISWSLCFFKGNTQVDRIVMSGNPNVDPKARELAIKEFENEHKVNDWKQVADRHEDRKFDAG